MTKVLMNSPLGELEIETEGEVLLGIDFGKKKGVGVKSQSKIAGELDAYFDGKRKSFSVEYEVQGTAFQKQVWQEIAKIPFGEVISYKELARRVGMPKGYRAVANACGKNPVPIVIPCHRVVASGGGLGGYSGGLWRKKWMLEMEKKAVD